MFLERAACRMRVCPSRIGKDMLGLALADLSSSLKRSDSLVGLAGEQRQLPHPVQNGAADTEIGVGTERNPTRRIESPRRIQQPLASRRDEIIKLDRTPN